MPNLLATALEYSVGFYGERMEVATQIVISLFLLSPESPNQIPLSAVMSALLFVTFSCTKPLIPLSIELTLLTSFD